MLSEAALNAISIVRYSLTFCGQSESLLESFSFNLLN
ncbi:hypothetical protein EM595_0211 [Duffyella gerundensis]|uniref:Uncharacterized protein n=1 Tax=Duffyella gerundensis TaxID=1619313 RepID=A0A0U5KZV1_9GAMM|nr:hypothetical protein EM595_0211 [Duffyella gerundensis]